MTALAILIRVLSNSTVHQTRNLSNASSTVFTGLEDRGLIIPVAIRAASMKVSEEKQTEIDKYLDSERTALAVLPMK